MEPQTIIARRIARELSPGMLVNLGIGIPTLVANHLPEGMQVFFQSENGLIGTGAPPEEGMAHPLLTDAGGRPNTPHTDGHILYASHVGYNSDRGNSPYGLCSGCTSRPTTANHGVGGTGGYPGWG